MRRKEEQVSKVKTLLCITASKIKVLEPELPKMELEDLPTKLQLV